VERKKLGRKRSGEPKKVSRWGFRGKTFYEVLSGVLIPLLIPLAVAGFGIAQYFMQQEVEDQRSQDAALQAYLSQMSQLLIEEDLGHSEEKSEVRTLARARTLTVLGSLDSERKRTLLRFLYEAKLIDKENPILDLADADFTEADLSGMLLAEADLSGANFAESNLTSAWLSAANLREAHFEGAKLEFAVMQDANLTGAWFSAEGIEVIRGDRPAEVVPADLSGAQLRGANLQFAHLADVDAGEAHPFRGEDIVERTNLSNANLREAYLWGANLSNANLNGANLQEAVLYGVDFMGAELKGADLHRAISVDEDNLAQAKSLQGATMPNGQKYEDWRKAKEAHGEDGEYSGPS
jgi:uncharacterized protein YjbI with pentapeptide repeats